MNERFKELAKKVPNWNCNGVYLGPYDKSLEQFAELIVREVIARAEQEEDRFLEMSETDLAYCMQNFQLLLKQEFGAKE